MDEIYFARIQSKDKRKVTMQADDSKNARGRADACQWTTRFGKSQMTHAPFSWIKIPSA